MDKKILIVDDDFFNVQVLQAILKNVGYEVQAAYGGKEAIDFVRSGNISMVLLDVLMPGIDGFDVLDFIKSTPEHCETPVVVVSAIADSDYVDKAFQKGAVDYVTKPFINSEILSKVEKFLEPNLN